MAARAHSNNVACLAPSGKRRPIPFSLIRSQLSRPPRVCPPCMMPTTFSSHALTMGARLWSSRCMGGADSGVAVAERRSGPKQHIYSAQPCFCLYRSLIHHPNNHFYNSNMLGIFKQNTYCLERSCKSQQLSFKSHTSTTGMSTSADAESMPKQTKIVKKKRHIEWSILTIHVKSSTACGAHARRQTENSLDSF